MIIWLCKPLQRRFSLILRIFDFCLSQTCLLLSYYHIGKVWGVATHFESAFPIRWNCGDLPSPSTRVTITAFFRIFIAWNLLKTFVKEFVSGVRNHIKWLVHYFPGVICHPWVITIRPFSALYRMRLIPTTDFTTELMIVAIILASSISVINSTGLVIRCIYYHRRRGLPSQIWVGTCFS